jgi:hypothetical protein
MLNQLLRVCTGFGGNSRKLCFLLRREMYFHVSRLRSNRLRSNAIRQRLTKESFVPTSGIGKRFRHDLKLILVDDVPDAIGLEHPN